MDITLNGSATSSDVHGSIERMPGAFLRAMAALFLRKQPETSREALAIALGQHLIGIGVRYHVRTLKRQLTGAIESVPPEVETAMREVLIEINGLRTPADIERALAASHLRVAPSERMPDYIAFEGVRPLIELWLYLNPGRSMRSLARRLHQDLGRQGSRLTIASLQAILAGQNPLVRRALRERLLGYLAECGVPSETEAQARWKRQAQDIRRSIEGRQFVPPERFRQLCRLWQLRHHEASSRRLALLLQQKMSERGVSLGLHHYQEMVNGKTRRVRQGILEVLEDLVRQEFPKPGELDQALAKVSGNSPGVANLCWVQVQPIASLAREWLAQHPRRSRRRLAFRIANTVRRMGYACSHHTIQSILDRGKQKTRWHVYRALLKQFRDHTHTQIPQEHIIRPAWSRDETLSVGTKHGHRSLPMASSGSANRKPAFTEFIRQARQYLPSARSDQLLEFLAVRAEHLYGVPRDEVKARLRAQKSGRRFRPDSLRLQTDSQEPLEDAGQLGWTPPMASDPEHVRFIKQADADEPVSIV